MKILQPAPLSAAVLLAALTLVLAACSDDDPACPNFQLGAVEGIVTAAGEPVAGATVLAFPAETSPRTEEARAVTDSAGRYRLDLANGLYWVEIQLQRGAYYSSADIDTVRVSSNLTHLDFPWGCADIRVGMPDAFEGQSCHLFMEGFPPVGQDAVVTGGWAAFSFPLLRPQTFTMKLRCGRVDIEFPAAMTRDDPRDSLVVGPDEPAAYVIDFSSSYTTLSGRITGGWEQVGGSLPHIEFFSPDSLRLGSVAADQAGNFTVELLAPGEIVLHTDHWGGIERWIGGASCAAATHYDLQPGDHLTGIEIPESRIRLTLHGPGEMIDHDAAVRLVNDRGQEFPLDTDYGTGPRIIGNLDAGRWYLQANGYATDQTWAAQWYQGADSLGAATPIDLGEGEGVDLAMDLVPGGSISGQVLMFGGTPLFKVDCALFEANGKPLGGTRYPFWPNFEEGRFTFPGLPDGPFYVAAINPRTMETVWYPGTTDFAEAETVVVSGHEAVTGITFDLEYGSEVQP